MLLGVGTGVGVEKKSSHKMYIKYPHPTPISRYYYFFVGGGSPRIAETTQHCRVPRIAETTQHCFREASVRLWEAFWAPWGLCGTDCWNASETGMGPSYEQYAWNAYGICMQRVWNMNVPRLVHVYSITIHL